jgi:hypothetical protein
MIKKLFNINALSEETGVKYDRIKKAREAQIDLQPWEKAQICKAIKKAREHYNIKSTDPEEEFF